MLGEAEGSGREYLERWPRDRVILGSIHPYRLPDRHSGSVAWASWEPQISLGSALLISNHGHRSALFGTVALQRPMQRSPRLDVDHCVEITLLSGNTVT